MTVNLEKMDELWSAGLPGPMIAAQLGVTRSTVMAVAYRNRDRFPLRGNPKHKPQPKSAVNERHLVRSRMAFVNKPKGCPLSKKQLQIVQWLAYGKTYAEISKIEGWPVTAIYSNVKRAFELTEAVKNTGLVAMAIRKGWVK